MPKYRPSEHVIERLNKKQIPFTHCGNYLEVKEEDITLQNLYILRPFEKVDPNAQPQKPKRERPPANYSNPQWNKLEP